VYDDRFFITADAGADRPHMHSDSAGDIVNCVFRVERRVRNSGVACTEAQVTNAPAKAAIGLPSNLDISFGWNRHFG